VNRCVYCSGRGIPNTRKYDGWCCWAAWSSAHPIHIPRSGGTPSTEKEAE
jgi:hypothetical protein